MQCPLLHPNAMHGSMLPRLLQCEARGACEYTQVGWVSHQRSMIHPRLIDKVLCTLDLHILGRYGVP
jgi:hypothetical protein